MIPIPHEYLIHLVRFAGVIFLLLVLANFIAPRMLNYRESTARMEPFHREVFFVHGFYIVLTLVGMAAACLFFPADLAGGAGLARGLAGFLALFWVTRVAVQFFYYDRAIRRRYPVFNVLFSAAFLYLAALFTILTFH